MVALKIETTERLQAADLFCGSGGLTEALRQVCAERNIPVNMIAVNHWQVAIATHSQNYPEVSHFCENLEGANPSQMVPGGKLGLLVAAPSCVHYSKARGGKPMSDQQRASPWCLMRWIDELDIDHILMENVPEIEQWGPLYPDDYPLEKLRNRPIPERRGEYFNAFVAALKRYDYKVEWRVLRAADYGDATTRERFFLQAKKRRGKRVKIRWPEPTHMPAQSLDLYRNAKPWKPARDIIDWTDKGTSIYGRKTPLTDNTLRRIFTGLVKFSGLPFLIGVGGPTGQQQERSIDQPLGTITGINHRALVEPFLVILRNGQNASSIDNPVPTICTSGAHVALCQPQLKPFIMQMEHSTEGDARRCYDPSRPLPTVCGKAMFVLVEPYLIKYFGVHDAASLDEPLPTITANYEHFGLIEPYLIEYHGGRDGDRRVRDTHVPLPTLDTSNRIGLVTPFLVRYHGNGANVHSVDDPLPTIDTRDRFALIEAGLLEKGDELAILDILFRMLRPKELAAAHSFPKSYFFSGNRGEQVKQIGNSVPVEMGKALFRAILGEPK